MRKLLLFLIIFFVPYLRAETIEVTGQWEGQLLSPKRPIVLYINFDKKTACLDATGSQQWPLEVVNAQGPEIKFIIALRDQKLEFSGTRIGGQISGILAGERTTPFSLDRLPDLGAAGPR